MTVNAYSEGNSAMAPTTATMDPTNFTAVFINVSHPHNSSYVKHDLTIVSFLFCTLQIPKFVRKANSSAEVRNAFQSQNVATGISTVRTDQMRKIAVLILYIFF